jgi:hypothetical protein
MCAGLSAMQVSYTIMAIIIGYILKRTNTLELYWAYTEYEEYIARTSDLEEREARVLTEEESKNK